MIFLNDTDLTSLITADELSEIVNGSSASKDEAEAFAMSQVEDYLSQRYDTDTIFKKTGDARSKSIVMVMCDLCLFHLHAGIASRNIPELRQKRYDDAVKWLKEVRDGKLVPKNLPVPEDDPEDDTPGIWGLWSDEKFESSY